LKKHELSSVGDILQKMTRETPLGENLRQAEIWKHWETIAGPKLSRHGRPQSVRDMQLRIEVDSPVWMHKFSYRKWDIVRRINRMARREMINAVFLVLIADGESMEEEEG